MKKIFLTLATAALFTVNSFAADRFVKEDDAANVTYAAVNSFNSEFVKAKNVSWKVSKDFQKATFTLDDVEMSAFYNTRGELIGVTQTVQYKELPAKAKKQIAEKYQGYIAKEVIKLETGAENSFDATVYFVDLKKDNSEVLVKVTPAADVDVFQKVK